MRRESFLSILLALFCGVGAVAASAQKSSITVKGSELNNGVVILDIVKAEKSYKLQCNQGASGCTVLNSGRYQMLELPENVGMYECKDVQVYPQSAAAPDTAVPDKDKKLGEYCLVEK
jgi:hypothetical protein